MKRLRLIAFVLSILVSGCTNTVGTINLKGQVVDEYTKVKLPNRTIIVQAWVEVNEEPHYLYLDSFTTDSTGCFAYTLHKVKNVSLYNFTVEDDADYAASENILGLTDMIVDGWDLVFKVRRLTDFTIQINRSDKTFLRDTLLVSWKTDGIDGTSIYPYGVENYMINPDKGLVWIGGEVKSKIKTKVYADKNTVVRWELFRKGRNQVITDTIYCLRNVANNARLNY